MHISPVGRRGLALLGSTTPKPLSSGNSQVCTPCAPHTAGAPLLSLCPAAHRTYRGGRVDLP